MPSDSEFAFYAEQVNTIIGKNRAVILTFIIIAMALTVVGGFSVYMVYSSMRAYRARLRTFPSTSIVGRAQMASDDNTLADDVNDEREALVADMEYQAMTKILDKLRLQVESLNIEAIRKSRDDDIIDEKIFVKDHDDYTYPKKDVAC